MYFTISLRILFDKNHGEKIPSSICFFVCVDFKTISASCFEHIDTTGFHHRTDINFFYLNICRLARSRIPSSRSLRLSGGPMNRIEPFLKHLPSFISPTPKWASHLKSPTSVSMILYPPNLKMSVFIRSSLNNFDLCCRSTQSNRIENITTLPNPKKTV